MLKGLDPLLTPDLLYALAQMGHGDTIALVDRNFPAHSVNDRVIRLDGTDAVSAGRAVLGLLPLDTFIPEPIARMAVVG
ncbi:RbsD/FucU domain-containing protein, partial [Streptomyces sp. 2MCAF27]